MRNITLALLYAAPLVAAEEPKRIELSVLYVGAKDDPRTAEFTGFLSKTFTRVEAIGLEVLSDETASGADVVIVDSPTPYKGEGKFHMPRVPLLGTKYTRPTILMGAAGGVVLSADVHGRNPQGHRPRTVPQGSDFRGAQRSGEVPRGDGGSGAGDHRLAERGRHRPRRALPRTHAGIPREAVQEVARAAAEEPSTRGEPS